MLVISHTLESVCVRGVLLCWHLCHMLCFSNRIHSVCRPETRPWLACMVLPATIFQATADSLQILFGHVHVMLSRDGQCLRDIEYFLLHQNRQIEGSQVTFTLRCFGRCVDHLFSLLTLDQLRACGVITSMSYFATSFCTSPSD